MAVELSAGKRSEVVGLTPETLYQLPPTSGMPVGEQSAPRHEDYTALMQGGVAAKGKKKKAESTPEKVMDFTVADTKTGTGEAAAPDKNAPTKLIELRKQKAAIIAALEQDGADVESLMTRLKAVNAEIKALEPPKPAIAAPAISPVVKPTPATAATAPAVVVPPPAPVAPPAPKLVPLPDPKKPSEWDFGSIEMLRNTDLPYKQRQQLMNIAVGHYNSPIDKSSTKVRQDCIDTFELALQENDPDVFYVAFSTVMNLDGDKGLDLTKRYVFKYAEHKRNGDGIGIDTKDGDRFAAANYAAIKKVFVLENVDGIDPDMLVQAISRVLAKNPAPEKLTTEQLWISALIEVIGIDPTKNEIVATAITNRILDKKITRSQKVEIMKWLAAIYKRSDALDQKQAVLAIFENVRTSNTASPLYAGMLASNDLSSENDPEGMAEMLKYAATVARLKFEISEIANDRDLVDAHRTALVAYNRSSLFGIKGFSNGNIDDALLRLVEKPGIYDTLLFGDLDIYRLLVGIEGLKDVSENKSAVTEAALEAVTRKDVSYDKQIVLFSALAKLFNAGATKEQSEVVGTAFDQARVSDNQDIYFAGLTGAAQLNDERHATLSAYISNMAERYVANDAMASKKAFETFFHAAVKKFSEVEPDRMRSVIDNLNALWFANPNKKVLWSALMNISEISQQCYVDPGAVKEDDRPEPPKMYFEQAVRDAFTSSFTSLPNTKKGNVAGFATKYTLDPAERQLLPVELLDSIIEKGPKDVRLAVLKALGNAANADEKRLVRFYLALIGNRETRAQAILEGEKKHRLSGILTKYLIKEDEPEKYRDPAHAFFRDERRVDGKTEAPIVAYGVPRIGEIETNTANAKKGEIEDQCRETKERIYEKWRAKHGRMSVSVSAAPIDTTMPFQGKDPIASTPNLGAEIIYSGKANANDRRREGGLYGAVGLGGKLAAGVTGGWTWGLGKNVDLSARGQLGLYSLDGDEPGGKYNLNFKGAEFATPVRLSFTAWRGKWQRAVKPFVELRPSVAGGNAVETRNDGLPCGTGGVQCMDGAAGVYGLTLRVGGTFDFLK